MTAKNRKMINDNFSVDTQSYEALKGDWQIEAGQQFGMILDVMPLAGIKLPTKSLRLSNK